MSSGNVKGVRPVAFRFGTSNDQFLQFELHHADTSYANALRRVMVSEVATLAISSVVIQENTSPLFDEFIAHRMGLIPLHCDILNELMMHTECNFCSSGCSHCTRLFELNVTNTTDGIMNVTSNHLICTAEDTRPVHSSRTARSTNNTGMNDDEQHAQTNNSHVMNTSPIVIVKLAAGQSLRMTCRAIKSIGKEHARHIPGHVSMFPAPIIKINNNILSRIDRQQRLAIAAQCPSNSIVFNQATDTIDVEDSLSCVQCQACVRKCEEYNVIDGVVVQEDEDVFYFTIEAFGQLTPGQILRLGLQQLKGKINTVTTSLLQLQESAQDEPDTLFG